MVSVGESVGELVSSKLAVLVGESVGGVSWRCQLAVQLALSIGGFN